MQIEIWPLVIAVFSASVLGSMHCAGMCGAFLAIAVTQGERAVSPALLQLAYHGGRLLTYSALGAVAGLLGSAVDLAGEAAGIGRTAAVGAGVMMIGFGAIAIMRHYGVRIAPARVPRFLQTAVAHGHRMVMNKPPLVRSASIGLLTTLLPCGWLYAFAITAAGTGRADTGALTMAVFWVGTLPVLVTLGTGLSRASGLLKRRMPLATSLALIAIGTFTAMDRLAVPAMATHGKADASIERLSTLADETPACCAGPGADEDDQSAVGEKP
ncbi:MAG: sulfite exporter TauE/SafE family protein [Phycisphaeraceae bacterium]|nr:sulfite exporter TauE/SafE family protein [Phycisphaeraceae bacterium]